jgi:hypothetical protein
MLSESTLLPCASWACCAGWSRCDLRLWSLVLPEKEEGSARSAIPIYEEITINRVCAIYLGKALGLLLTEIEIHNEHLLCWPAKQHVGRMGS